MKLYTYDPAPNPKRLTLFMAYKGIEIETQQIDMMAAEQLGETFRSINSECTVPALVLDDGTVLTEVVGICCYLEELYPSRPLMGQTALERAQVISWDHKLFVGSIQAVASMLRNSSKGFTGRALSGPLDIPQIPELVDRGLLQLQYTLPKLDAHLAQSPWVAGKNFTLADIDLLVVVDFMAWVKQTIPEGCKHLSDWHQRASAQFSE